jgi:sugar lactone lactonase YvrE
MAHLISISPSPDFTFYPVKKMITHKSYNVFISRSGQASVSALVTIRRAFRQLARNWSVGAAISLLGMGSIGVPVMAGPGDISVFAGGGRGDGATAVNASLAYPSAVAFDGSGNVYIAEGSVIRKVSASTGLVSTVAGTGLSLGDNGPATKASLNGPEGVVVDSAGNLFIADTGNHRIRKVAAGTGIITTVAGTGSPGFSGDGAPAATASLNNPVALAFDGTGNLYVADQYNQRIRKIGASTAVITTVAGNGTAAFAGDGGPAQAASLWNPYGITFDSADNLYIVDQGSGRVRKVFKATGAITTALGGGSADFVEGDLANAGRLAGGYGIALDLTGNVYVVDSNSHRVLKLNTASGIVTKVLGGTFGFSGDGGPAINASIEYARGITFDAAGNIYVADTLNGRVRKVSAASDIVTTFAGTGSRFAGDGGPARSANLALPSGVALDGVGNMYIADTNNNRIRRVNLASGVISTVAGNGIFGFSGDGGLATSASLAQPTAIAVDKNGNLFITDQDNYRIRKIVLATGIITSVAGNGGFGFSADNIPALAASLWAPTGLAIDSTGDVYFAESFGHRIRKVSMATGLISTIAGTGDPGYAGDNGPAANAKLNSPANVSFDTSGNIFIADAGNGVVRRISAQSGNITTFAGTGVFGALGDGGPATAANLVQPVSIAFDIVGNVYIVDSADNRVRKVSKATGKISTVTGRGLPSSGGDGGPAIDGYLHEPKSIAIDTVGNIYIADSRNDAIREVARFPQPTNDVSGDKKSDLFYRDASGAIGGTLMDGLVRSSTTTILAAGSGWSITHVADLDGDGYAELITRHTDGRVNLLIMNGTTVTSTTNLITAGSGWTVTHAADLNGDGKADLILKSNDGRIAVLIMNGTSVVKYMELTTPGSLYTPTHVGDFNGDGKADIMLKHTDGSAVILLMDGTVTAASILLSAGGPWSVSHVADLNGDGKADVVIKNANGSAAILLMNGITVTNAAFLLNAGGPYTVTHTGDFDGDGKADLLIRSTDGSVALLQMNGTTVAAATFLLLPGSTTTVAQVADYNGDGKSDILLRNADGSATAILMNGGTVTAAGNVWGAGTLQVVP